MDPTTVVVTLVTKGTGRPVASPKRAVSNLHKNLLIVHEEFYYFLFSDCQKELIILSHPFPVVLKKSNANDSDWKESINLTYFSLWCSSEFGFRTVYFYFVWMTFTCVPINLIFSYLGMTLVSFILIITSSL